MNKTIKVLAISTVIQALETIYKNEKPKSLIAETNDSGEVIYFKLRINDFNPYSPYAHTTTVGRAVKTLNDLGLIYTNDDFCIFFNLNKDKLFSSAVGGWYYSFDDVNKIIEHFRTRLNIKPKQYKLEVGDFIVEYNDDNEIRNIYSIVKNNSYDYVCLDTLNELIKDTIPTGVSKSNVVISEDSRLKPISRKEVESLVVEIEKDLLISELLRIKLAVSNIKEEDLPNYYKNTDVGNLISMYKRYCTGEFKLYKVFDKGVLLYDPMIKKTTCWGH